jgi:hypothetical protein
MFGISTKPQATDKQAESQAAATRTDRVALADRTNPPASELEQEKARLRHEAQVERNRQAEDELARQQAQARVD